MIGQTISHYRIVEKVGGGGMGVVVRCQVALVARFTNRKSNVECPKPAILNLGLRASMSPFHAAGIQLGKVGPGCGQQAIQRTARGVLCNY